MNELIQTKLLGAFVEVKPRQNGWTSSLDTGIEPIKGVVVLIAVIGHDIVMHVQRDDGWIESRASLTNFYRVIAPALTPDEQAELKASKKASAELAEPIGKHDPYAKWAAYASTTRQCFKEAVWGLLYDPAFARERKPDDIAERAAKRADEILPGLGDLVRKGTLAPDPFKFRELPIGSHFRFVNPPAGFATCNLVKVETAPGFAMGEGWDFALASDKDIAEFECEVLAYQIQDEIFHEKPFTLEQAMTKQRTNAALLRDHWSGAHTYDKHPDCQICQGNPTQEVIGSKA